MSTSDHRHDQQQDDALEPPPHANSDATDADASVGSLSRSLIRRQYRPVQAKVGSTADRAGDGSPDRAPTGAPLDSATRELAENAFDTDFSAVRVGEDAGVARAGALAMTQGEDVSFAPGALAPATASGRALLGHELAHVVQQRSGQVAAPGQAKGDNVNSDPGFESEADLAGEALADGRPVELNSGAGAAGTSAAPGVVQAKLAGVGVAFQAQGRKSGWKGRMFGSDFENIVKQLREYEAEESGFAGRQYMTQSEIRGMVKRLDKLEKACLSWLGASNHKKALAMPPLPDLADPSIQDNQNDDAETANEKARIREDRGYDLEDFRKAHKLSAKDEEQVRRIQTRGSLLQMLLPRIRQERVDLNSGRFLSNKTYADDTAVKGAGKDNAVGGALNRLDIVKYGPAQETKFFKQEATGKQDVGDAGRRIGIAETNPNAGARSVAMSRLDELLKSGVIAKTDFGTHTSSTMTKHAKLPQATPKVGLVQAQAEGKSMQELIEGDQLVATDADKSQPGKQGAVSVTDPELQKKLSILQVIDVIAGQMDRHGGNFYIQTDPATGKVSEVTGIDLDMSFGKKHTDIKDKPSTSHYKGMPALVDRKFAERVLSITDDQLRAVLEPLLGPEELAAAMGRWIQVQNELKIKRATNQLVDQWGPATAREQTDPDSSYLGQARAFLFQNAMDQALAIVKARLPGWVGYWNNILGPRCVKRAVPSPDLTPQHMLAVVRTVMDDLDNMPEWQEWRTMQPLAMAARTERLAALKTSHDLGAARDAQRFQRIQPDEQLKAKLQSWQTETAYAYIDFYKAQPDLGVLPPPAAGPGPVPTTWQEIIDENQRATVRSGHAPAGWKSKFRPRPSVAPPEVKSKESSDQSPQPPSYEEVMRRRAEEEDGE